jgi:tetratricopeptide (TPR) repeat protein
LNALRRPAEAEVAFKSALRLQPGLSAASVGLSDSAVRQGRFDDALGILDPLLKANPGDPDAAFVAANVLIRRGQFAEGEVVLERSRTISGATMSLPQRANLDLELAAAQLAQGKIAEAGDTQKRLAQFAPDALLTRMLGARVSLAKGEYLNGIAELQRVVTALPDFVEARMLLGAAHLAQGNFQQAERHLQQVVQVAPDNIEARKLLARVQLQLDRPDAALRVLTPALDKDSTDSQLYALLGAANDRAGDSGRAIDLLERSVKARPDDVNLRLQLASGYIRARRFQPAIALLRAMPPESGNARREAMLITAVAGEQGPMLAREELGRLMAAQPDNVELRYLSAGFFVSQREFERARADLRRLLDADPKDARALAALARIEFADGNLSAAEQLLQRAIASDDRNKGLKLTLAQLYLVRGDAAQARTMLDQAIAAAQGDATVVNAAGQLLLDAQRYDEALARFRRATDLDATNATYWFNAARAQAALNQPAAARESAMKALHIEPDSVPITSLLVLLDLRTSGPGLALQRAQELRARKSKDPAAIVLEGDIRMASKQYEEAVRAFEDAERIAPDANIAVKLFDAIRLGNRDRPEAPLLRWLGARPEDSRVRVVLAQYYNSTNRAARAITEFETVLRQSPNNPAVLNNLAWLYNEQQDDRAEALARRAHDLAPSNASIADTFGWILLSRKKTAEALPLLQSAAQTAADDPQIQYHYGAALVEAGRSAEARKLLTRLIETTRDVNQRRAAEKLLSKLQS